MSVVGICCAALAFLGGYELGCWRMARRYVQNLRELEQDLRGIQVAALARKGVRETLRGVAEERARVASRN